ncbi:MarR family winged helix-turn-helix transcriptional regulator [Aquibacillus salsiterrae]|uniref:MarR family transcriptional regulator n=1 Tax=Aquibacillus salsiterrae TaxID=2950439 RepID=A0A9X3WHV4_9BACI|nr:MarR family transcriptional regulator [Aquibacillus salsiterrae]MDC3417679.1 MarR family transcriptional regulator [Aquibacillus salsiterrae]
MNKDELHDLVELYTSAMNEVTRRVNQLMNAKVHQELTTDQFSTLRFVLKRQSCTSTDIAQEFSIGKSAVTAQVNRLVERELLHRKRDDEDRRIVYLSLTPSGVALMEEASERLYEVLGKILLNFDRAEVETFVKTLEKLVGILRNHKT